MISQVRDGGVFPSKVMALTMVLWGSSGSTSTALGDDPPAPVQANWKVGKGLFGRGAATAPAPVYGTLGPLDGYYGFGLSFHQGRGYGGGALGVNPDGGYPFYGGPGYCQPGPVLRRFHGITPFPYFGGPGFPTPEHPHFFGGVGPLVPDEPVITIGGDGTTSDPAGDYGNFTGVLPYPESAFAPFSSPASPGGSDRGMSQPAPPTSAGTAPDVGVRNSKDAVFRASVEAARSDPLGIEGEPVIVDRVPALKVSKVHGGSAAEKAGLQAGDVIRSINGYVTSSHGDLAWIINNASRGKGLTMTVRSARDGTLRTMIAKLP